MKIFFIKFMFYTLLVVSISGCGARIFNTRGSNPVLEDYVGTLPFREVGTLTTDAAHRTTVIRMNDARSKQPADEWQRGEFCAEPPPDSMVNIAAAFETAIKGAAKDQTMTEISGQLDFAHKIATIMNPLLRRSQGLQWSRDNLSFLCHAYLNRTINKEQYVALIQQIFAKSSEIIIKEIDKLPKLDMTYTGTSVAPVLSDNALSDSNEDKDTAAKATPSKDAAAKAAASSNSGTVTDSKKK